MFRRRANRSRVHMLTVAAARLEQDRANPKLIESLRAAAKEHATAKAGDRDYDDEQRKRIDRQRTLFNMLPNGSAKEALKKAALQRAYDLLWDGNCAGCDAVTEFLPSMDVEGMLSDWGSDQIGKGVFSRWYRSE